MQSQEVMAQASRRTETKRFPVYCPLDVSFNAERLYGELIALLPAFESLATKRSNLDRSRWFPLGEDSLYASVEHYIEDPSRPNDPPMIVPGAVPSWRGVSLTHVPHRPETGRGSNRYRRKHDGEWAWKSDLDVPYTRALLESLPFTRFDTVRVMSLPPGGFGPAHADCRDDTPWEIDGIASITFLLRDGGVKWRFMDSGGRVHDVNDPVFFFKDCAPHGVPQTTSWRLLLRVNGAADSRSLSALMRTDGAVW
jgi:hypothetical protein